MVCAGQSHAQVFAEFGHRRQGLPSTTTTTPKINMMKLSKYCTPSDKVVIEPEFCPEAVENYTLGRLDIGRKATTMKAKKHLSATGWTFYYALIKSGTKRELKYCSPTGKVFHSLLTACKSCVHVDDVVNVPVPSMSCVVDDKIVKLKRQQQQQDAPSQTPKRGRGMKRKSKSRSSKRVRDISSSTCQQTPRTVLSWLIDTGVVLPSARVEYRGKNGTRMAEGRIAREGIQCSCCGFMFTLTKFEAHAGSTYHRPAAYIFLEDGRSLMECQLQLRKTKGSLKLKKTVDIGAKDLNDDICSVCQYGGELVLCDQCPSSFHTKCLGLKGVPDGDWFCPSCCCRICGTGRFDFDGDNGKNDSSVLTCIQCEHRYHAECLSSKGITKCYSEGNWFCQDTCEQIFCSLRKILGKPIPVGTEGLTWMLLKYMKPDSYDQSVSDDECGLETYGKLNVALSVMHECFEPVKQADTGRDLVEDVIFSKWSELNRLNFRGFYTVVLEKNDDLISAATLRIHGKRVAEVPLVATRSKHRRLGMCRILMNELEKKLMELGVENLVLPAVGNVLDTWTNSFGFSVMNETERLEFLDCTFLDFQDTTMCKKVLTSNPTLVSSQATGKHEESSEHVSKNVCVSIDDVSAMSEFLLGDQVVVDETEFIDQKSTWWIDELLNI